MDDGDDGEWRLTRLSTRHGGGLVISDNHAGDRAGGGFYVCMGWLQGGWWVATHELVIVGLLRTSLLLSGVDVILPRL